MLKLVLMVEEPSMEISLNNILPQIITDKEEFDFQVIPHSGKSDLEKSIPRKLRAWHKFIIIRDQDNGDCIKIKEKLQKLCNENHRPDSIIRIVCQELESWFIGDLAAIEKATGILIKNKNKSKYRNPDKLGNPSEEIKKICLGEYSKIDKARKISKELSLKENRSHSYNIFISTIKNLTKKDAQ